LHALSSPTSATGGRPERGPLVRYLAELSAARAALWCYLIWYLVVAFCYFDPSPRLWLTSVGLSLIIGVALVLNAASGVGARQKMGGWQRLRFFLAPFCVSSFAALVKGKGFFLVFSPDWREVALGLGSCGGFLALVGLARWRRTGGREGRVPVNADAGRARRPPGA
jgi:hypothetical protein